MRIVILLMVYKFHEIPWPDSRVWFGFVNDTVELDSAVSMSPCRVWRSSVNYTTEFLRYEKIFFKIKPYVKKFQHIKKGVHVYYNHEKNGCKDLIQLPLENREIRVDDWFSSWKNRGKKCHGFIPLTSVMELAKLRIQDRLHSKKVKKTNKILST